MSLFDKQKDEMLINLVRGKPVIYDSSHPQHRNLIAKHAEWKEISAAMDIPSKLCFIYFLRLKVKES